ncbi:MAG TPA: universal stress protein [Polyangiaceae bacterium]|nr:universal stress protein [Polyangiaceae bacterium]
MSNTERTIVVGVDYSDHSIHAVDEALRAHAESRIDAAARVRLVAMLVLPGSPVAGVPDAEAMTRDLVERSKDNLVQLLQARARTLGVTLGDVEPRVDFGPPAERLLAEAKARGADLIVVGTHGREGLSHLLLGSVADEVMRKAQCSVLVARASGAARGRSADTSARTPARERAPAALGRAPAAPTTEAFDVGDEPTVVSEPHIDAGRVVLHVLDAPSGQVFVCAFADATTLGVEPLEGSWVPAPSSDARARVARIAHDAASKERPLFDELFEEIARRRARADAP